MDPRKMNRISYIRQKLAENPEYKFTKKITQADIEEALAYNKQTRPTLNEEERQQRHREAYKRWYEKNKQTVAAKRAENKQGQEPKKCGRPRLYTDEERQQRKKEAQARFKEKKNAATAN